MKAMLLLQRRTPLMTTRCGALRCNFLRGFECTIIVAQDLLPGHRPLHSHPPTRCIMKDLLLVVIISLTRTHHIPSRSVINRAPAHARTSPIPLLNDFMRCSFSSLRARAHIIERALQRPASTQSHIVCHLVAEQTRSKLVSGECEVGLE